MSSVIGPLDLEEIKVVRFEFGPDLVADALLATAAVAVSMKYGVDETPNDLLVGMPVVVGRDVEQRISGAGRTTPATYHLRCRAVAEDGQAHVQTADVEVKRL